MKAIYIAGGKANNTAINILKRHLETRGHRVTRDPKDPDRWAATLRWGISYHGNKPAINANCNRFNKMEALYQFERAEIPGPIAISDWRLLKEGDFPVLARNIHHTKGKDIIVCKTKQDAAALVNEKDFFTPWIPTKTEYRVWVLNDNAFAVYEKEYKGEGEYQGFSRNRAMNFKFVKHDELLRTKALTQPSIQAVKVLDMEFGAVDVLLGKDGKYYVLEANTMPHIDSMDRSSGIRLAAGVSKWAEGLE
jgi:glutathione synthase/RimK-type ligase-like ATP-grasp enzyme